MNTANTDIGFERESWTCWSTNLLATNSVWWAVFG